MFWYFNPHFRKGSDDRCICYVVENKYFNPHFRKGSDQAPVMQKTGKLYFNPHFRKGSDIATRKRGDQMSISIHTSAREVTAIFHKNICLFLWNIYKYIWIYFRILLKYSVYTKSTFKFVYFYRCESPGNFMYARHSHLQIIRIKADRLQFLVLHLYALSWSYNYFQDSRIASYLLYHQ